MAIVSGDIVYRLSGGASNSDPSLSIGGAKSSVSAGSNLFDALTSAEAAAGDIEYRCFYVHNAHATLTMLSARSFIPTNTSSPDTVLAIGVGAAAVNGTETAVANESTAPAGVTFSSTGDYASGVAIGDIPPGQHRAVWLRRTVNASAASATDISTVRTQCDTNP